MSQCFLVCALIIYIFSLVLFVVIKRRQVKNAQAFSHEPRVQMSALGGGTGMENPLYSVDDLEGGDNIYNTADEDELVKKLESM